MNYARFRDLACGLQRKGTHVIARSKQGVWSGWSRIEIVYVNKDRLKAAWNRQRKALKEIANDERPPWDPLDTKRIAREALKRFMG